MTTLEEFATKYQVKVKKDSCGDLIIPGRLKGAKRPEDSSHLYEADGHLWLYLVMPTTGRFNGARKKLEAAGGVFTMALRYEGFMRLDLSNEALVRQVLKLARIKVKRQLTDEQKAVIRARFAKRGG